MELTDPVQKNFYAAGHKYKLGHGEHKEIGVYIGAYKMSDGYVEHMFVRERFHEELKRPFIICDTYHDSFADTYIFEV